MISTPHHQVPPRRPRSRGQALVITSLVLMVLLAFAGLAIDTGFGYVTQRQEQTAADAASLDASTLLDGTTTVNVAAFAMAQRIADANGYSTSPAACSSGTTSAGQVVYVYAMPACAPYATQVVVKVPPDRAILDAGGQCASASFKAAFSCVEVDIVHLMPTSIERLFGVKTMTIRATSVAYNGRSSVPLQSGSANPYQPPVSCSGGAEPELGNTPGATWTGSYWKTPNPVQSGAGGPWVWTLGYHDEWPLDAYTAAVYTGSTAASGHFFSQGVWVNQSNTSPPASNLPGPDTVKREAPAASQVVGAFPAAAPAGSFYTMTTTTATGMAGASAWTARFADGTTLEISGNWDWGGVSGLVPAGGYVATLTFTVPASGATAGGLGLSAFFQDGDDCGDTVLFETQTPPSAAGIPSSSITLDG